MSTETDWQSIWEELKTNLDHLPKCPLHSNYPCISTLVKRSLNDIIEVSSHHIIVRSHKPKNGILKNSTLSEGVFRTWWEHLHTFGSATFKTGNKNNPVSYRSSVVAAIFVKGLPQKIRQVNNSDLIELIR